MKIETDLDRRDFLQWGTAALGCLLVAPLRRLQDIEGVGDGTLLSRLRTSIPRAREARRLGHACRRVVWGSSAGARHAEDVGRRVREVEAVLAMALGEDAVSLDSRALASRIARRTKDDFRAGRTVRVEGWVLAHTEVLVYGAASAA